MCSSAHEGNLKKKKTKTLEMCPKAVLLFMFPVEYMVGGPGALKEVHIQKQKLANIPRSYSGGLRRQAINMNNGLYSQNPALCTSTITYKPHPPTPHTSVNFTAERI